MAPERKLVVAAPAESARLSRSVAGGTACGVVKGGTVLNRISLAIVVLLSGWLVFGCGGGDEDATDFVISPAGTPETLGKQMSDANKITGIEGQMKEEQAAFIELAAQYKEATGESLKGIELATREAGLLRHKLENEEDVTYSGLIRDILERQEKIDDLRAEMEEIKSRLPLPVTVQRGDRHYGIGMDYLTNQIGLSEEEASKAIKKALLTDRLVPGHEVWNFYENGVYGTAVTQGTAKVSPYFLNVQHERKILSERDEAQDLAMHLQAELEILEHQRDQLTEELEELEFRHTQVVAERDHLHGENVVMETHMSSAHYYVDTVANLRSEGIVKIGGKRLKDYDPALFIYSIDLRDDDSISLAAGAFGKNSITGADLLPKDLFIKNTDYTVDTSDRGRCRIRLYNLEKFENERFVIVLH